MLIRPFVVETANSMTPPTSRVAITAKAGHVDRGARIRLPVTTSAAATTSDEVTRTTSVAQ
jgi:hypothetical protein